MSAIITGDSHVRALRLGISSLPESAIGDLGKFSLGMLGIARWFFEEFFYTNPAGVSFTREDFNDAFMGLTGKSTITEGDDTLYGFCLAFNSVHIFRHRMWKFYSPWNLAKKYKRTPISDQVFERIWKSHTCYMFEFLAALKALNVDFFVIAAPPPRRDHPCIQETSKEIVLEVDRRFRELSIAKLKLMGVPVITPPAWAYGEDGFMAGEFEERSPGDYHHANLQYGRRLFIEEVSPRLASRIGWRTNAAKAA